MLAHQGLGTGHHVVHNAVGQGEVLVHLLGDAGDLHEGLARVERVGRRLELLRVDGVVVFVILSGRVLLAILLEGAGRGGRGRQRHGLDADLELEAGLQRPHGVLLLLCGDLGL